MKFLDRFLPSFVEKRAEKTQNSWASLSPDQRVDFLHHAARERLQDITQGREKTDTSMKRTGLFAGGFAAASIALTLANPPVALVVAMGAGSVMALRSLFQSESSNIQQKREHTLRNIAEGSYSMDQRAAQGDNFGSIERTLGEGWNSPEKIAQWQEQTQSQGQSTKSEQAHDFTSEQDHDFGNAPSPAMSM